MENKKTGGQMSDILKTLDAEQQEKLISCKGMDEFVACLGEMGAALPDNFLDEVAGGFGPNETVKFYCEDCKKEFDVPAVVVYYTPFIRGIPCNFCNGRRTIYNKNRH